MQVLKRYFTLEFSRALLAVTAVLSLIVLGKLLLELLNKVAKGKFPPDVLLPLLGLGSVRALIILLPLGLLVSLMLVLGRMYRDNEITVLRACGLGQLQLFRPLLPIILLFIALLSALSLFISPWSIGVADRLGEIAKERLDIRHVAEGHFRSAPIGDWIVYVEQVNKEKSRVDKVFIHSKDDQKTLIETAQYGVQGPDPETGEEVLTLFDGYRYEGLPGDADFRIVKFKKHITRIPDWKGKDIAIGAKEAPIAELLSSVDAVYSAELQWRISTPIAALLLAFLAFPLSQTTPRQGRFAKLGIAIFIYLVYVNMILVSVNWVGDGALAPWIGVWWTHLAVLSLALFLYFKDRKLTGNRVMRPVKPGQD